MLFQNFGMKLLDIKQYLRQVQSNIELPVLILDPFTPISANEFFIKNQNNQFLSLIHTCH